MSLVVYQLGCHVLPHGEAPLAETRGNYGISWYRGVLTIFIESAVSAVNVIDNVA